ncbi:type VI secretion system baseplate subunit TssG [soil metagenome]
MAADAGAAADALIQSLAADPYEFDFFQAVRRLQCARADLPEVGLSKKPADDPIRFSQEPSTSFATSTLGGLKRGPSDPAPRLMVNFMGMLGPSGPMPLHISDFARQRERNFKDPTLARFLDIFNHRMVSLLFRAWALNQPGVLYERTPKGSYDPYSMQVAAMIGLGQPSLRDRDALPDEAKLFFAGRLASQSPNPEGLLAIVRDYFKVPAQMDEFVGRWADLPAGYRCRLGADPACSTLGGAAGMLALGARYWDRQGQFRIRLGPMTLQDYQRLLPRHRARLAGGRSFRRLEAWVLNYLGFELSWEVQLALKGSEVPRLRLGGKPSADPALETGCRLGWTTWLAGKAAPQDRDDLVVAASHN